MKYNCYILLRYRTGVRLCPLKNNVTYKCLSNKTTRISNEKDFLQYFTIISVFSLCHIKPEQTTSPVTFVDPHFALTNKTMNREKVFKYSSDIYVW